VARGGAGRDDPEVADEAAPVRFGARVGRLGGTEWVFLLRGRGRADRDTGPMVDFDMAVLLKVVAEPAARQQGLGLDDARTVVSASHGQRR
jgi:hypothetical protein